jgi:hypothetical protein
MAEYRELRGAGLAETAAMVKAGSMAVKVRMVSSWFIWKFGVLLFLLAQR